MNNQKLHPLSANSRFRFTKDMVETALTHFDDVAGDDGVITIEQNHIGLWLVGPNDTRQFLGQADMPHPLPGLIGKRLN